MEKKILLLGDKRLYQYSESVTENEIEYIREIVQDLHDTMMAFREKYGVGRAIAAPQIGIFKRIIYMHIDKPVVMLNPVLKFNNNEMMEVMDDCMSFPSLLVKVLRYRKCTLEYYDMHWNLNTMELSDNLSELIQHEYDHLDGILATMKAIDKKSFFIKEHR